MNFALDFKRAHANQSKKVIFQSWKAVSEACMYEKFPFLLGFQNLSTSCLLVNSYYGAEDVRKQLLKGSLLGFKFEAKEKTV